MTKDKISNEIRSLRENKSCSQSTLIGLCNNFNCKLNQEELEILGSGFSGGIGGTFDEGTCGAVTGAIIALGLLEKDPEKVKQYSKELFEKFKNEYTSVRCDIISKKGKDKTPCVECCVYAANIVADSLK